MWEESDETCVTRPKGRPKFIKTCHFVFFPCNQNIVSRPFAVQINLFQIFFQGQEHNPNNWNFLNPTLWSG